jgi:hypothetical protein
VQYTQEIAPFQLDHVAAMGAERRGCSAVFAPEAVVAPGRAATKASQASTTDTIAASQLVLSRLSASLIER